MCRRWTAGLAARRQTPIHAATDRERVAVRLGVPGEADAGSQLTRAISAEMEALYTLVYGHERASATTYINGNVVLCVLENILTDHERMLVEAGSSAAVIDARVAFQTENEDEFTEAVERLTRRRVVAFMSANQTTPGVAAELFFLEPNAGADASLRE